MIWFGLVLWHINHCRLFNANSPFMHIYQIYMIWFGCVLWHIDHCRLFNAKYSLYIYIKYVWFGLVGFYGISTIVGYSMPNHLYTFILSIYDLETNSVYNIFKWSWAHFFFAQLNGFTHFYQIRIIIFSTNHLFAHCLMFSSIAIYRQQFN